MPRPHNLFKIKGKLITDVMYSEKINKYFAKVEVSNGPNYSPSVFDVMMPVNEVSHYFYEKDMTVIIEGSLGSGKNVILKGHDIYIADKETQLPKEFIDVVKARNKWSPKKLKFVVTELNQYFKDNCVPQSWVNSNFVLLEMLSKEILELNKDPATSSQQR